MIRIGCLLGHRPGHGPRVDTIYRLERPLQSLGFDLARETDSQVDLLWIGYKRVDDTHLCSGLPIVIDEPSLTGQVSERVRKLLREQPSVVGVTKPHLWRPRIKYDLADVRELDPFGVVPSCCISKLMDQLHICLGLGCFNPDRNTSFHPGIFSQDGSATAYLYDGVAIQHGKTLTKGRCDWLDTYPDIYRSGVRYKIAGNDVEPFTDAEAKANRDWFLQQTTPEALAEHVAGVLRKCVEFTDLAVEASVA